jgi:hypothetical protein
MYLLYQTSDMSATKRVAVEFVGADKALVMLIYSFTFITSNGFSFTSFPFTLSFRSLTCGSLNPVSKERIVVVLICICICALAMIGQTKSVKSTNSSRCTILTSIMGGYSWQIESTCTKYVFLLCFILI